MIKINNKQECCGCTACVERCPRHCIVMQEDEEGFLYPIVDEAACIHCNVCDSVCPIINGGESQPPIKVYAAKHIDEGIRKQSSSGGVFTALAEETIQKGGVVFGARFNSEWQVVHSYTETIEGISAFRGSKYVQSSIGNSYRDAEYFLNNGREVLFSGTPCQIAGLKHYLKKEYNNLVTVDFICHGVPSPLVWKKYVETLRPKGADGENSVSSLKKKPVITGLFFRDKRAGWRKYGFSAWKGATEGSDENTVFPPKHSKRCLYEIQQQNIFLRGFLQNLYLRPSCHHCHFRNFKSGSDVTIADFWGVRHVSPGLDDDKGLSLIIIKNGKCKIDKDAVDAKEIISTEYETAFRGNSALFTDIRPNQRRDLFWRSFISQPDHVLKAIKNFTYYSLNAEIRNKVTIILLKVGFYNLVKKYITLIRK